MIDEPSRMRVIRALVGIGVGEMAKTMLVSVQTVANWESGRAIPNTTARRRIVGLCRKHGIAFLPSGMPVPTSDALEFKRKVRWLKSQLTSPSTAGK